jgi:hypothetical protein
MFDWFQKKEKTPAHSGDTGKKFAFRAGQMVKINRESNLDAPAVQTVVQETYDGYFSVLAPARREDWPRGTSVRASLYVESGLYSFTTTVLRSYVKDRVLLLDLAKPKLIRRFQRRKYKRLTYDCVVTYDVVFDPADENDFVSRPRTVASRDISASGICLRTERFVAGGSICHLSIIPPGLRRAVRAVARVLDSKHDAGAYQYLTRMEYIGIMEKNRILIDDIVNDMGGE